MALIGYSITLYTRDGKQGRVEIRYIAMRTAMFYNEAGASLFAPQTAVPGGRDKSEVNKANLIFI